MCCMVPCALSIAGSDSCGGAGIQADIKTMTALGVYAETVITAITAQNTRGVQAVEPSTPKLIADQMDCVFSDIVPDAVKIGMLPNASAVSTVAEKLVEWNAQHIVLDPVMVATTGASLSEDAAVKAMKESLVPLAEVITPNIIEASILSGNAIASKDDMVAAGIAICGKGSRATLVKGGHIEGCAEDVLVCATGEITWFRAERIETENTHGTGCTLSSAIASYLALGFNLETAIERAKHYLSGALIHDLDLGSGYGPVNHMWDLSRTNV